ncbi:DUF4345 domain-containing protein [Phaeobacter gallaeciensis]|uniref:DUF4345 domain-containing protein n=1 Tax=Phaeobacter gallaeciensis TaxID=60890 RepID=UPI000BBCE056|nr:DUF4345 domain-containing protein [Phaeobacter gallaeciensis]ATF20690.1 Domain protein of unknown function [Phaeobacter gallaeciensis]ATF24799.1 Domain protein of unknown function [Phaeobacter gallaeciensis]
MHYALRTVLTLTGIIIIALGLNVALGGIQTLGWQGADPFLEVTDPEIFAVRDNHVRFIAGVWMAVGLLMILGATRLRQMRSILLTLVAMVFTGGVMRLSAADTGVLYSMDIAPSLIAELVLFPILGWWIFVATHRPI